MAAEHFRNLVIGGGEGGKYLAWHLAESGQSTAVVERRWIGGSCPNINCLPSKNEIWSAKVADLVRHASDFGVSTGSVSVDMAAVRKRKRDMVEHLVAINRARYKSSGTNLFMGEAKFSGAKSVELRLNDGGTKTLTGERVFLNLGTHAAIPPVPGLADAQPLTHIEALELDRLPEHLVVIGGGYVGIEFAQAYRRFGSRVTVIQHGPQLLGHEDPDAVAEIMQALTSEGIEIITQAQVDRVEGRSGQAVSLVVRSASGETSIRGSDILVATGRIANTAGIGLETIGVKLDSRGFIQVNERLETTAPDTWAIGECAGSPQFTHASFDDYRIIRDNLAGKSRSTSGRLMPYCLFTDPQLAHVGLSETEAKRQGIPIRIFRMPTSSVLRAQTTSETRGFLKALVGAHDDRILGFTMIGADAGEVMTIVQTAMLAGMPFTALRDAVITHPTMAEGLVFLFSKAPTTSVS
jgi:pyruvate/2-oxoglutarate dehydrogenase complex dihydrolipoamide dehydrogenase (E3) component